MRRLTTIGELEEAASAFQSVFTWTGDERFLDEPFVGSIERKIILCLTGAETLAERQFEALCRTSRARDEAFAFISPVSSPDKMLPHQDPRREHWLIELDEASFEMYRNPSLAQPPIKADYNCVANVIYSTKGIWGVFLTMEEWGFLGATNEFIELFLKEYRDISIDFHEFIRIWEHYKPYAKDSWALRIVDYIYGDAPPAPYDRSSLIL